MFNKVVLEKKEKKKKRRTNNDKTANDRESGVVCK